MGNCLSSQSADDLSLLNESEGASLPGEPPPPYREHDQVPVYHPTPSQSRLATQLTEEEQIRIAQRIGLIQHLPKGIYDPGSELSEKKVKDCGAEVALARAQLGSFQERLDFLKTFGRGPLTFIDGTCC